jgi:hypothetical protein
VDVGDSRSSSEWIILPPWDILMLRGNNTCRVKRASVNLKKAALASFDLYMEGENRLSSQHYETFLISTLQKEA